MPAVALTFDDGPSEWTEAILDILARNDAQATFFLIGFLAETRAETVRRIAAEGHELGNHSWSHPHLTRESDSRVLDELRWTNDALTDLAGVSPSRFRAPFYDADERVESLAEQLGLLHTPSTLVPPDWHPSMRSAFIATLVVQQASPGSIVGLHDGIPLADRRTLAASREETVKAVASFVPRLRERGFEFLTASSLLSSPARS